MRELIVIGAGLDVARGLPAIHANLLGYDEQAHRRGPSSAFAHWTLMGIDFTIYRIWQAARRSTRRDYDLWIYSDHGQQETIPFAHEHGQALEDALAELLHGLSLESGARDVKQKVPDRVAASRVSWLSEGLRLRHSTKVGVLPAGDLRKSTITAMGPLGHLYLTQTPTSAQRDEIANRLVRITGIPLVLWPESPDCVAAHTRDGRLQLPRDAAQILGADHPFLREVTRDLVELCQHEDAGTFVLSGWRLHETPISFPHEHGAHGGPGPEETGGFALLPTDAPVAPHRTFLRPLDLRFAALTELGRGTTPTPRIRSPEPSAMRLRIMTYNVHYCVGRDHQVSVERIARVIRQSHPDVVALQEVDIAQRRSGHIDQVREIAQLLEMECHFHPAWQIEEELQGDAILSRFPMRLIRAAPLPHDGRLVLKPRGALWVELSIGDHQLQLINTHLDVIPSQQRRQIHALLSHQWLGHPDCHCPRILCGDFNFGPRSPLFRQLQCHMRDVQTSLPDHEPHGTWFVHGLKRRIDHIFVSPGIETLQADVPRTEIAVSASDHLPLIAVVGLEPQRPANPDTHFDSVGNWLK